MMILSSCQTTSVVKDVHMGADIVSGGYVIAYIGLIEALHVAPVYSTKDGFALKTSFQSPRRMKFVEAWSYGKQFSYSKTVTEKMMCLLPPCAPMVAEQGIILMTDAEFTEAASHGFEFQLVGKTGKIVAKMPAQSFRAILDLKNKHGLVSAAPSPGTETADKMNQSIQNDEI